MPGGAPLGATLASMGYLISAHILAGECDFSALGQLPPSFGYAVYLHEGMRCYLLDLYASRKPPNEIRKTRIGW